MQAWGRRENEVPLELSACPPATVHGGIQTPLLTEKREERNGGGGGVKGDWKTLLEDMRDRVTSIRSVKREFCCQDTVPLDREVGLLRKESRAREEKSQIP